jgi:hypothetical protein
MLCPTHKNSGHVRAVVLFVADRATVVMDRTNRDMLDVNNHPV